MASNIYEKVLENVKIVDVISNYIELIPKGKNFFGICPFHNDTNPSMSVSPEKGIFYCFTCKTGGNAIKFVQDFKHISMMDAAKEIAARYHIDVSEFSRGPVDKTKKYYELMLTANKFFKFLMSDENYSKEARKYLYSRGLDDNAINMFEIGLAPDDPHALSKQLIQKGFLEPDIILNGLANENNDMFVSRIIVPIKDEQGRTVAFGGRIYKEKDKAKDINKYLNSTDTPIFRKGELVFNLNNAVKELRFTNYLIINEGYMDVVTASSKGIKNSVALMGTKMTNEQAQLIAKYAKNVVICLDGDNAGITNVNAITERLTEVKVNYSIVILPNNMDPDEYIRTNGKDKYLDLINNHSMDKLGYLYELAKLEYPKLSSTNIDSFKNKIFTFIKDEKSQTIIETYLRRLSNEINVSFESISQDYMVYINRIRPGSFKRIKNDDQQRETFHIGGSYSKAEHFIIDYSLKSKLYFKYIESKMDSRVFLRNQFYRSLFIEIGDIYDGNHSIKTNDLILELTKRGTYKDFDYNDKLNFSESDLDNVIETFKIHELKQLINEKTEELKSADIKNNRYSDLIKEISELKKELKKVK